MLARWMCKEHVRPAVTKTCFRPRYFTTTGRSPASAQSNKSEPISSGRTRNIGIIAHIDAGKTTTTERMLYYSGFTRRIGDVDEGSTVTDFLPAERARGITIQSAAISFSWPPTGSGKSPALDTDTLPRSSISHNINLIDTPGHADFTFEVLRSLRVLDGAVCILDGVAGVEAQTEKVWAQASAYAIPRIVFVNKLDRDGAAFGRTLREIGARLNIWPATCGIPWWNADGTLKGVGDILGLRALRYPEGGDGKDIEIFGLEQLEKKDQKFAAELRKGRVALVELLSEHDDITVEKYLEADEDHLAITSTDIIESLRRCVLDSPQQITPVFAGASFRNVGVQPLLDAVVDLLPSPLERPDPEIRLDQVGTGGLSDLLSGQMSLISTGAKSAKALTKDKATFALQNLEACALAFKVVADARRGVLVYVRVYSGTVSRNAALWNTTLQTTERAQKLLKMYANEAVDIEAISAGQIGVIPGLKSTRTGDTLISYTGANPKIGPPAPINTLQLRPIDVPPPVFFVGVEPNSLSEEKHIKESLDMLLREDPSLHVSIDEESGQTHLSGMGELHLEIARDRLVEDLKAKARIGNIEIGYREAITAASDDINEIFERDVGGKSSKAGCIVSISPRHNQNLAPTGHHHVIPLHDNNCLTVVIPTLNNDGSPVNPEQPGLPDHLNITIIMQAFRNGTSAALARGPTHSYPLHSTDVVVKFDPADHLFPATTPAALASATRNAVQRALRSSAAGGETVLMEPVMLVTISADEDSMGAVVHDLSSARGGTIISLGSSTSSSDEDSNSSQAPSIDLSRIHAPPDHFAGGHTGSLTSSTSATTRQIVAKVPLKEMLGYLRHLRSLTAGRGTFTMVVDRFERMNAQRQRAVLNAMV